MNKIRTTVDDVQQLHLVFRRYRSHHGFGSWFRGQADIDWKLLPKAGRNDYYLPKERDLRIFQSWRMQAIAFCTLPDSEIEQLALAQHHGLATRLLDWSKNPLVACYFACNAHPEQDGVIFILEAPEKLINRQLRLEELKSIHGVFGHIPRAISPRVLNQRGLFTVHCDAQQEISVQESNLRNGQPNLVELIVPSSLKSDALKMLNDYGIDRTILFPDLDGLSEHINSDTRQMRKST